MDIQEIISICERAIPEEDTWEEVGMEEYGAYNIPENLDVKKILYCVTATDEVIHLFKSGGYDLLISHHPFVRNVPMLVFHTALDCCVGGLNDYWQDKLGVVNSKHFDVNLGGYGKLKEPIKYNDLIDKIEKITGHKVDRTVQHKDIIESVVICTGLGGMVIMNALDTKADCYILGQLLHSGQLKLSDRTSIIEMGHTASEMCGAEIFRKLLPNIQIDISNYNIDYFNDREQRPKNKKVGT